MYEKTFPNKRFKHTLEFLKKHVSTSDTILDLGVENPFSKIMKSEGFSVTNTTGEDLDKDQSVFSKEKTEVVTAFEIFEHFAQSVYNFKRNQIRQTFYIDTNAFVVFTSLQEQNRHVGQTLPRIRRLATRLAIGKNRLENNGS